MTFALLLIAVALTAADPPAQIASVPAPPAKDAAVSGVTVNGSRQQQPVETSIDRRSYSVANDLMAATGSIADVLRNIPSVQVDFNGNISLRGDSVTILVDGKPAPQFSGESLAPALQSLPANQIDRIEVITNPSAEFRADGAGIINLISKKAKGAGRTGSVRIQGSTGDRALVSANIGYNSNKLSTTADFSYRRNHRVPVTDHEQLLLNSGGLERSRDLFNGQSTGDTLQGHVGGDYDLDSKTRLSASIRLFYNHVASLSVDDFEQDGDPTAAFRRFSDQHEMQDAGDASLILRHKWADGHDLTMNATYHDNRYAVDRTDDVSPILRPARSAETYRVNFNRTSTLTADYQRPLSGMAKLKLGYDFEDTDNYVKHRGGYGVPGAAVTPDPFQTNALAEDETYNQAYVTYEQPFGKLDALLGLRGEWVQRTLDRQTPSASPNSDYSRLYPTLHLAYDLDGGRRLIASYSKRVVRPSVLQLDPFTYSFIPGLLQQGNPNLVPQETDSYEFGYEARKDAASLLATFYYRQSKNAFSLVATPQPDGAILQTMENAGVQENGGFELVLANRLTAKLSYSFNADAYWVELSASNLGFSQTQSAVTGFGSANLNWQVTPKDFVQFNVVVNGKILYPQGYQPAFASGNIGYRHTINDKVSWTVVVQDLFNTRKTRLVQNIVGGRDLQHFRTNSRMLSLTVVWNFAGKAQPVGFDF